MSPQAWRMVAVLARSVEAGAIVPVLAEIKQASVALAGEHVDLEVLLVDDGADDTRARARAAADQLELKFDIVDGPRGAMGRAIMFGMRHALARDPDSIVTLDADGQHDPLLIPRLHRAFVDRHHDVVIGSRWARGGSAPGTSRLRRTASRLGNLTFRVVTGTRGVRDATTSFRVYSPRAARFLIRAGAERFEGYSFFSIGIALCEAAGLRVSEVPITFRPRSTAATSFDRREVLRFFATLPSLRAERRDARHIDPSLGYLADDELTLLTQATRWNRFLLDETLAGIEPHAARRIVEIGCGHGAILTALRSRFPEADIVGLEPDPRNVEVARRAHADDPGIEVLAQTLEEHLREPSVAGTYDGAVFLNVLEHIEHDTTVLAEAAAAVRPGGWVGILVPARPGLYGPIDFKSGHHRRYSEQSLADVIARAGLVLERVGHLDALGVLPYWINYRLLNKSSVSTGGIWAFENVFVPATRVLDRPARRLRLGKNLVALARRPADAAPVR